jgi:hypothetical protein
MRLLNSSYISARPCACVCQMKSNRTEFHEVLYGEVLLRCIVAFQFLIQSVYDGAKIHYFAYQKLYYVSTYKYLKEMCLQPMWLQKRITYL